MYRVLGIVVGSGVYQIAGLQDAVWRPVKSPFGAPSDDLLTGRLDGMRMVFLPRHGRGHIHTPTSIPYRANIDAMKRLGVIYLVSVSACGSFCDDMAPGDFVIVDQFIDRTFAREKSFFGPGLVANVRVARPNCARLGAACADAARAASVIVHDGGTYLAMEGQQFSNMAESILYRESFGCDVIGMTNMPEAKLAREAEICYASIAMITDYDSWHPDHGAVDISSIIATLSDNADKAKQVVAGLPERVGPHALCPHCCDRALNHAILTAPDKRDPAMVRALDAVAGRVLG